MEEKEPDTLDEGSKHKQSEKETKKRQTDEQRDKEAWTFDECVSEVERDLESFGMRSWEAEICVFKMRLNRAQSGPASSL